MAAQWRDHDDMLAGGDPRDANNEDDDSGGLVKNVSNISIKGNNESAPTKGSRDAVEAALKSAWSSNAIISNPYGVGSAMGSKQVWIDWARCMAGYPDELDNFWGEYYKDMEVHKSTLDELSKAMEDGSGECIDYIKALACIFFGTFSRSPSLDPPPFLNLELGMMSMNLERMNHPERLQEPVYKSHMKVWEGYKNRTFRVMKIVQEHPLLIPIPSREGETWYPLENRGEFPTAERRIELDGDSDDEYDDVFGGACGFSGSEVGELLSQGVKPWDDDTADVIDALNGY